MASGADKGARNVEAFRRWQAAKTDDDYRQMVHRGALSRTEIARECRFAKSALLQNPAIRAALKELEDCLRARGVLPPLDRDGVPLPSREPGTRKAVQLDQRLKRLEQENAALRAEVGELKAALKRYALLEEVMAETGRVPR